MAKCPACGNIKLQHDTWEDMYLCLYCDIFLYPEEVGEKTNRNAPIFNLK